MEMEMEMEMEMKVDRLRPGGPVRLQDLEARAAHWLARHSITLLRISLGLIFLAFGLLKFFPGHSPAAVIAEKTLGVFTFGLLGPNVDRVLVATLETTVGLCLTTGWFLRLGLLLLGVNMVGILSPLVLFPHDLFPGGLTAPSLLGQYVLKDAVLLCAGLVVAASALGGRLVVGAPVPVLAHAKESTRRRAN
jgi:putative oxidoreductase